MLALLLAGSASAGEWIEVSCENPNLSAAPSEGWSSFSAGAGFGSNNTTGCAPGNPMYAILSADAAVGVGANETLQYTPPPGSALIGGAIDVSLYADGSGYDASGTAVAYTPNYAYDGSDVFFQCASGQPPCSSAGYDYAGGLQLPSGRGGNLYLSAGCGGGPGAVCNSGGSEGAWSLVRLWWADLLLQNAATPSASGFGGTLLAPEAHGLAELTFTASDAGGPGVYATIVQVDGTTVYDGVPDTNGGRCTPVGSSADALMFDFSQPCRASESVDLPVDTTALPDGQHTLKVIVSDAAGNSSVVYDGPISTHNPTPSALPGPGPGPNPSAGRGAPNGLGADEHAQLRLDVTHTIVRSFRHRAFQLSGHLLDSAGNPIAGATLDLSQRISGATQARPLEQVRSGGDGAFAATVPPGPSRTISVGYRAFSGDTGYASQASIKESVAASIALQVSPRRTNSEGEIILSGQVAGPLPRSGVIVELLVHYRGRWEPFRAPRTKPSGHFETSYTFQGAVGRFPFRAEVYAGQSGLPYAGGRSHAVVVSTG